MRARQSGCGESPSEAIVCLADTNSNTESSSPSVQTTVYLLLDKHRSGVEEGMRGKYRGCRITMAS